MITLITSSAGVRRPSIIVPRRATLGLLITSDNDSVVDGRNEYECCPLRFCLLRNTPHWGNIVVRRPSALFGFASLTACL
jgi:hypothetical protein